jgi:hypothetical protein
MATRYQRCNQNSYIKEEQTTQWPQDTKDVIRICISKKDRQHNGHRILITPLVSCGHCVVSPSSIYEFWLHLWYRVAIVLSVLLLYTDSDYTTRYQRCNQNLYIKGQTTQWPQDTKDVIRIRILKKDRQHNGHPLVSCGHCVVCPSSIYGFWLHLWYLVGIVLSVLLRYTDSDYTFGILWPLCCLSFFDIRILITPLQDTKGVIRIRISKKDRQHNGHKIPKV